MTSSSKLAKRLGFGTLLIAALTALLLLDGYLTCQIDQTASPGPTGGLTAALIILALATIGCFEIANLLQKKGLSPSAPAMDLASALVLMQPYWQKLLPIPPAASLALAILACLALGGLQQARKRQNANTLTNLAALALAAVYLGIGGWFILQIRLLGLPQPRIWGQIAPLTMFLITVKSCDIGAYFTGRYLGRHKWVPAISPAKTWEGLAGGCALAAIVASIFAAASAIIPLLWAPLFGVAIALAGQLGDLLESMLKRDADVKDSASLIPEFGGVLDLLDSVLAAAPLAYILFNMCTPAQ